MGLSASVRTCGGRGSRGWQRCPDEETKINTDRKRAQPSSPWFPRAHRHLPPSPPTDPPPPHDRTTAPSPTHTTHTYTTRPTPPSTHAPTPPETDASSSQRERGRERGKQGREREGGGGERVCVCGRVRGVELLLPNKGWLTFFGSGAKSEYRKHALFRK